MSTGDAYVYADVDENTVLKFNRLLREGRLPLDHGRVPVDLQLADEDGFPHRGYIESEDNRLDPATGSLSLRMVFANPHDELLPGLFARVRVPVSAPRQTVLISERAIGTDQSQKYVLACLRGKQARLSLRQGRSGCRRPARDPLRSRVR